MKKIFFCFCLSLLSIASFATTYYSVASADVTAVTSWNSATNLSGTSPADFTNAADLFIIQSGHLMTTSTSWTVAGSIKISNGGKLTATNLITCVNFTIDNEGTYVHNVVSAIANGVATDIPGTTTRTFNTTSTVEIQKWGNGGTSLVGLPSTTWGNLIINVASLSANWVQTNTNFIAAGDVTIKATGGSTNVFKFTSSAALNAIIGGNLNIEGGYSSINQASSGTNTITLSVSGNYNQTGGSFALNDFAGAAAGTFFTQLNVSGNMTITGGAFCGGGHWGITATSSPNINYAIYITGDLNVNGGVFALNRFVSNIRAEYVSIGGNVTVGNATGTNFTAPGTWSSGNGGSVFYLSGTNPATISIDDSNLTSFSITGLSVASGSTSITIPDGYNVLQGMLVTGTGLANPTYISAVSGTTLTLSTATTASVTDIKFTPGITNAGWVIPAGKTVTLQSNLLSDRLISVGGTLNMGNYTIAGSRLFTALPTANISFTGTVTANDNKLTAASPGINGIMPGMTLVAPGILADNTVITQTSGTGQIGFCPSATAVTTSTTGISFNTTSTASTISTSKSNFIQSYNSATQYGGANYSAAIMNKIRYFSQETNLTFNGTSAQTFTASSTSTTYRYNGVVTSSVATTLTTSTTLTLAQANALVQPGQYVLNSETVIGTVASVSGTSVTLTANASAAVTNVLLYFANAGSVKNLTINNPAGLFAKTNLNVSGTLNLANGILSIDSSVTVKVTSGNDISGAPFSSSKYISTLSYVGRSAYGNLAIDNISSAKLFPVGTATNYLPVTITPASASNFTVAAIDSVTTDGTRNGTSAYVGDAVNATWKINRSSGSGSATVLVSWPSALEGVNFSSAGNSIGISNFDGTAFQTASGTGDNVANTASASFSSFASNMAYVVVKSGSITLPVSIVSFSGSLIGNATKLEWTTNNEINVSNYVVEKSTDGINFITIGAVNAYNTLATNSYAFTDASISAGVNYYRLKINERDGSYKLSSVIVIVANATNKISLSVFPNPTQSAITITHPKVSNASVIQIFTNDGRQVLSINPAKDATQTTVNVSALQAGNYIVAFKNDDNTTSLILVKK